VPLRDVLLALLVTVVWGTNFVVIHVGLSGAPPLLLLTVRFVAVLVPALFLVPRPKVPFRQLALVGLLTSAGQFSMLYLGMAAGMPAGLASLVLQAQVLLTLVVSALVLGERPDRRQSVAVVLGGVGLVVVGLGRSAATPLVAVVLCVGAAFAWACGNVVTRRLRVRSGLSLTIWSATVVPVPVYLLSLWVEGPGAAGWLLSHLSWQVVASTAYTAYLSSVFGFGLWNTLLARHPAAQVTPFALGVPIFGMLAAWLFLHEMPGRLELVGGAVVLLGVAVAVLRPATGPPPITDPVPTRR
jgi:O-acetylserine/cysteine efflux transporter